MSVNSFGRLFRFATWGESHGPAIGAVVDGCPPGLALDEADIQHWLDRRRPGASALTSARAEPDRVRILSGVYEGRTTGTPISLDHRQCRRAAGRLSGGRAHRPGHADGPMRPNTACATRAAAAGPRRARRRRGSRRARWRGW